MQAVRTLPTGYQQAGVLDLSKNFKATLLLNLAAIPLLFVALWGVLGYITLARAGEPISLVFQGVEAAVGFLLLYIVMIVLHEAIHGICFWWYTRARPKFGLGWTYAYAAAPGWYIPRNAYFVVALAPFAVITLGGALLLLWVPPVALLPVGFVIVINAAGCIGDFTVALWLLRHTETTLVQDHGSAMVLFAEQAPTATP